MAVYDLEEQEKLDSLKSWWRTNGNMVTWVALAVALAAAGYQGYRYWQNSQAQQASDAYAQLSRALQAKDDKKVRELGARIMQEFPSNGFATMAALNAAKASFDTGDLKSASAQLKWVVDNTKDEELKAIARLRLAGVLLDEKNYDGALSQLSEKHPDTYAALFADLRGDVLVAKGQRDAARDAYKLAIEKLGEADAYKPVVQVKLDDIGAKH